MRIRTIVGIAIAALAVVTAAWAAWTINGNPVCTATGTQDFVDIVANELGGAVMVWQDNRGTSQDIYAQSVDNTGVAEWTANGIPLCTAAGLQQYPIIDYDVGYLFYAWQDYRSGNADIYAAVTDRIANVFTPANGAALCTATGAQSSFSLSTSRGVGLGYVAWADARSGTNDIYMQAFDVYGNPYMAANGAAVCTAVSDQVGTAIVGDYPYGYGATVAWQDYRGGNYDIYAQRMDVWGTALWTANGVAVCTQTAAQLAPMVVKDGAGGVIIAWLDYRHGTFSQSIYAQRLNSSGVPQWTANGVLIAQSSDLIQLPKMISDGAGGAIFAWEDDRNISTSGPDVYAQRVSGSGSVLWTANGVVVCSAPYAQYGVDVTLDVFGGAVVTWFDYRNLSNTEVYAQHVENSGGFAIWQTDGIPVCTATGNQFGPRITTDGTGGCIVAWEDRRSGNPDIYALRLHGYTGEIGNPEPKILSVTDVPNDNGGYVTVQWQPGNPAGVNFYQIYRGTSSGSYPDLVANAGGDGSATYNDVVPTTADGVLNYFFVLVFTYTYDEYNSNEGVGMSQDDITPVGDTPGVPKALALRPNSPNPFGATTQLHVGLPQETDVHLEVFDVAGRRVVERELGRLGAGWRDVSFDGRDDRGRRLPSGVYFYRVRAGSQTTTHKMVIGR